MEMLKGHPYEGGKNWPKIVLSMRDEALGAKPLARGGAGGALENLNMKTELEVLEQRLCSAMRLWMQDLQFVWNPLVHGLPRPAQRVLRHLLRQRDHGQAPGLEQRSLRQELEAGRDTRDPIKRMANYV
jgi:hypothetical protein